MIDGIDITGLLRRRLERICEHGEVVVVGAFAASIGVCC
jgi:hypothetical protein